MHEPTIELSGNLGGDPELRITPNGKTVCTLRVAVTARRRVTDDEWENRETLWFKVTCWGALAENVAQSLKKGDKAVVHGKLEQESWTRADGSTAVTLVVVATAVGADLDRAPVLVKRPIREVAEPSPWTTAGAEVAASVEDGDRPDEQAA